MNSNITNWEFENSYFFSLRSILKVLPKFTQKNLKNICNGVQVFNKIARPGSPALPKNAPLQAFSITFAQICSFL